MRERIVCLFLFLSLVLVGSSAANPAEHLRPINPRCNPDSQFYMDMTGLERVAECERDQMQTTGLEQILREREWENHPFSSWSWSIWELDRVYDVRSFLSDNLNPYLFEVVVINGQDLYTTAFAIWDGENWVFLLPVADSHFFIQDYGPVRSAFMSGDNIVLTLSKDENGWNYQLTFNWVTHTWDEISYPPGAHVPRW